MSKSDELRAMRERNAGGKAPERLKPAKVPQSTLPAQPQKPALERDLAILVNGARWDARMVAKAIPFYLKHLERSKAGMRAHRAKLGKAKKRRKSPKPVM